MKVHYFAEALHQDSAMTTCAFEVDTLAKPEYVIREVPNKMEDLGYATALVFDTLKRPSLLYRMTVDGVTCKSLIEHE